MVAVHPSVFLGLCDVVHGVASLVAAVCRRPQFTSIRHYCLQSAPSGTFFSTIFSSSFGSPVAPRGRCQLSTTDAVPYFSV